VTFFQASRTPAQYATPKRKNHFSGEADINKNN